MHSLILILKFQTTVIHYITSLDFNRSFALTTKATTKSGESPTLNKTVIDAQQKRLDSLKVCICGVCLCL